MEGFKDFKLSKHLFNAIEDLGFQKPTPIQQEAFNIILSGKDVVGISQTGTGKTLAFMLPLLNELKYSSQTNPRIVVLVPTRELVLQTVERINEFAKYITLRVVGVYGGANINTQKQAVMQGADIVVGTPGRLYDLALCRALQLKSVKKLVIDEVDVMLDLGFLFQLTNIFDLLPERRQNIMFSATMTEEVDELINNFFVVPHKISIAVSGTPLDNIKQQCYPAKNFYTKINLLSYLLKNKEEYSKVLVFVSTKKNADRVYENLEEKYGKQMSIIHANKSQNFRIESVESFDSGKSRILIATDVMARGLDLNKITHVINFDVPIYPENYMHRIGRTGRAEEEGNTILFYTKAEEEAKLAIEVLMNFEIPQNEFPHNEVEESDQLTPEERPRDKKNPNRNLKQKDAPGGGFHEKKAKNKKVNLGGSYKRKVKAKYKKPKSRGDKNANRRKKK